MKIYFELEGRESKVTPMLLANSLVEDCKKEFTLDDLRCLTDYLLAYIRYEDIKHCKLIDGGIVAKKGE